VLRLSRDGMWQCISCSSTAIAINHRCEFHSALLSFLRSSSSPGAANLRPGRKAHLALPVRPAPQVPLVRADLKAHKGSKGQLVRKAPRVSVAKPARLARKDRSVLKVRRAKLVHRGRQGLPANAAKQDHKARRVRRVQQDLPGRRAIPAQHRRCASLPGQTMCAAQMTRS
jgi:hypothetical protein